LHELFYRKSSEVEWDSFTRSNLMLANNQIRKSRELRSRAEIVLRAVCEDICKAYDRTNQSFEKRIFETKIIKKKLENELSEVSERFNSQI
jgi:Tektin family